MGVELLEERIKSLEVEDSQRVQLGDPVVLLYAENKLIYESIDEHASGLGRRRGLTVI